ncbi:MAG: arylesterase [Pseudomonadota bacterium]
MKQTILALLLFILATPAFSDTPRILVLGDSLSAAYGIDQRAGWVALLQQRLEKHNPRYQVVNASISGETAAGGLTRLPKLLQQHRPAIIVIALGANDGLRGLSLEEMKSNLEKMIDLAKKKKAKALLVGMQLPPNYGPVYARRFQDVYQEISKERKIAFVPFLLAGIAENKTLFQSDGLHPTALAQEQILNNVWAKLKTMLK